MVLFIYFTLLQAYTTELELKVALLGEENAKLRKQQERVSTVEEECFFFF
jgi:Tfp pilus assembly protein PilN